jgi:hypothetical protein
MASTINAVVGGVTVSSDTSGALNIQTGGVTAIEIGAGQTVTVSNAAFTNFTATSATITNLFDGGGNVRSIPQSGSAKTSAYTLSISDNGEYIELGASGAITIPDGVFSAGNAVSVFNNTSGNATITCSITTAYIAGTDSDKATMTLATRGLATILFISNSLCVVNGNVS